MYRLWHFLKMHVHGQLLFVLVHWDQYWKAGSVRRQWYCNCISLHLPRCFLPYNIKRAHRKMGGIISSTLILMLYFSVLFKGHTGTCEKKHVTVFRIKLPNQRVVLSFKVIFQSIIEKKKMACNNPFLSFALYWRKQWNTFWPPMEFWIRMTIRHIIHKFLQQEQGSKFY